MEEEQIEPSGLQPWHWLRTWGLWLFVGSLVLMYAASYIPHEYPAAAASKYSQVPELLEFDEQLRRAKTNVAIYANVKWFASELMAGSFFMWLAGCVIDALRRK